MARKSKYTNPYYQNKSIFRKRNKSVRGRNSYLFGPLAPSDLLSKEKLRLLPPSVRSVIKDCGNSLPKINNGRRLGVVSSRFRRSIATEIVRASSEAVIKAFGDNIQEVSDNPEHIQVLGAMVASQAMMMAKQLPFRPAKVNGILEAIGKTSIVYEINPQGVVATHVNVDVEFDPKELTKRSNDNGAIYIQNLNVYFSIPFVENFYNDPKQVVNYNVDPNLGMEEEIKKILLDGKLIKMLFEKANSAIDEAEKDKEEEPKENASEENTEELKEENSNESSDETEAPEEVETNEEETAEKK